MVGKSVDLGFGQKTDHISGAEYASEEEAVSMIGRHYPEYLSGK